MNATLFSDYPDKTTAENPNDPVLPQKHHWGNQNRTGEEEKAPLFPLNLKTVGPMLTNGTIKGHDVTEHKPVRTCIGCRRCRPKDRMIRYVLVNKVVIPDPCQSLPGRGAYVCPSDDCLNRAIKQKAFARAFRRSVSTIRNTPRSSTI